MTPEEVIKEFNGSGEDRLFVEKLRAAGLNNVQIAAVIKALETTCQECWDNENGCHCWNDE